MPRHVLYPFCELQRKSTGVDRRKEKINCGADSHSTYRYAVQKPAVNKSDCWVHHQLSSPVHTIIHICCSREVSDSQSDTS